MPRSTFTNIRGSSRGRALIRGRGRGERKANLVIQQRKVRRVLNELFVKEYDPNDPTKLSTDLFAEPLKLIIEFKEEFATRRARSKFKAINDLESEDKNNNREGGRKFRTRLCTDDKRIAFV